MSPGRELDALIAEKVMGWPPFAEKVLPILKRHFPGNQGCIVCGRDDDTSECLPHYSTDIAAAWQVVEKMTGNSGALGGYGPDFQLSRVYNDPDCKKFVAEFSDNYGKTNWKEKMAIKSADTAPMAIVLAALKAVDK